MATRPDACVDLRCEYSTDPLGIDERRPRLSWLIDSSRRGVRQTAYHILVVSNDSGGFQASDTVWDSGTVESDQSTHIEFPGDDLVSCQRYHWRVRIRDERGEWTGWSDTAHWETGLLRADGWKAEWIEPDSEDRRMPVYFRKSFELDGTIASARAYVTSHGVYELSINGRIVGKDAFRPGYTSYTDRLQYQTYDVTDLLVSGENVIGIVVADGWYRGKLTIASVRDVYGSTLGALVQVRVKHRNGLGTTICSDGGWKWSTGPILRSDMKDGEEYDARMDMPGWDTEAYDGSSWKPVRVADHGVANLIASSSPPIRRQERISPIGIIRTPKGQTVIDFGQNIAGRVKFTVSGPEGTTVILRHGESLDSEGNFSLEHLQPTSPGFAKLLQEVRYTLKGQGDETYEPHFTYHGFRYAEVAGWPGALNADDFTAIALYSDIAYDGEFSCSCEPINRLHENIRWSMKGNYVDIPTDCPTRERSGWTGDVQIFARTGSHLADTSTFLEKWLADLAADQHANGLVPNTVPDINRRRPSLALRMTEGSAGWGDAAAIVPWELYQSSGDPRVLERQYASMRSWAKYASERMMRTGWDVKANPLHRLDASRLHREPYVCDSGYHWDEWLRPGELKHIPWTMTCNIVFNGKSESMVATAYLAHTMDILSRTADALGKDMESRGYARTLLRIKEAFIEEFMDGDRLNPDEQSSYVRALAFDLLPEDRREGATRRLVELIELAGDHIDTGFLSTPLICDVLSRFGRTDLAYRLLFQDSYPSWLYQVTKGATTVWESWDAVDSGDRVRGSLNHCALGSIGGWLYETVAGIRPDPESPGYRHFYLAPLPGKHISFARARHRSPYGDIVSHWKREDGSMTYTVSVPPNSSATVELPLARMEGTSESGVPVDERIDRSRMTEHSDGLSLEIGSGEYEFSWDVTRTS